MHSLAPRFAISLLALAVAGVSMAAAGSAAAAERRPGDRLYPLVRAGVPFCPARAIEARSRVRIALGCRGLKSARLRLVEPPLHGELGRIDQRRDSVRYRPAGASAGTDRFVVAWRRGGRSWRRAVLIDIPGPSRAVASAPSCRSRHLVTRFRVAALVRVTCRGAELRPLRLVPGTTGGKLAVVRRSGTPRRRTLTARLRSPAAFVGQDVVLVRARGRGGSEIAAASVSTLPWRMRALGDSVTAGFGYYANGGLMSVLDLPDCKPASVVSNRCSSNSDEGPDYSGPPEWSTDFGLANDVSWAAQFANDLQGGGHVTAPDMFQNRAVTGSAPSDWLPGGLLNGQLNAIVAENPELIAFTMGANPLLTDILLTTAGEACSFTESVAALESCVQPFFQQVQLTTRLQQFYTALLKTSDSSLVTFQYNLSVPSANLFDAWQLEAMTDYFNAQIATAVNNTRSALPKQADRLILIEAQTVPGTPAAQQLPRFNLGLPPDGQTWSPPYDCGDGDFVDGRSHQSTPTQDEFEVESPFSYCEGQVWIIGADSGIHPNSNGYSRFANTLANVAAANGLVPPLP
jgi:lysophospholipase L1-like esterase